MNIEYRKTPHGYKTNKGRRWVTTGLTVRAALGSSQVRSSRARIVYYNIHQESKTKLSDKNTFADDIYRR